MRQELGSDFTNGFMSFENLYHNEAFLDEFSDGVIFEGNKIIFSVAKHCFIQRPVINRSVAALNYQIWNEHCILDKGDVVMYGRTSLETMTKSLSTVRFDKEVEEKAIKVIDLI
jgi:hypothetical protein